MWIYGKRIHICNTCEEWMPSKTAIRGYCIAVKEQPTTRWNNICEEYNENENMYSIDDKTLELEEGLRGMAVREKPEALIGNKTLELEIKPPTPDKEEFITMGEE